MRSNSFFNPVNIIWLFLLVSLLSVGCSKVIGYNLYNKDGAYVAVLLRDGYVFTTSYAHDSLLAGKKIYLSEGDYSAIYSEVPRILKFTKEGEYVLVNYTDRFNPSNGEIMYNTDTIFSKNKSERFRFPGYFGPKSNFYISYTGIDTTISILEKSFSCSVYEVRGIKKNEVEQIYHYYIDNVLYIPVMVVDKSKNLPENYLRQDYKIYTEIVGRKSKVLRPVYFHKDYKLY